MNRRAFLGLLGGAITAVAAKPVLALIPADTSGQITYEVLEAAYHKAVQAVPWWEEANVMAFSIVGEINPEHRIHYRTRAIGIIKRMQESGQSPV